MIGPRPSMGQRPSLGQRPPMRPRRTGRGRGQALIETVIILPVLMGLFLGVYSVSQLISDTQTAGIAIGQGARLGAELGNGGYYTGGPWSGCQTSAADACAVDRQIVNDVIPVLNQMTDVTVINVRIYRPKQCVSPAATFYFTAPPTAASCPPDNGSYSVGDLFGLYDKTGNPSPAGSTSTYTLNLRNSVQPLETSIGVAVQFSYTAPAPRYNVTMNQYATVRIAPNYTG